MKAVSVHVIVIDRRRGRGRAPTPSSSVLRPSRMPVCGGLLEPRDSTRPVTQRLCSTQLWKMSLARRGPSQAGLAVPAVAQAPCCINEKIVTKGGSNLPKVTDLSEYSSKGHIAVEERRPETRLSDSHSSFLDTLSRKTEVTRMLCLLGAINGPLRGPEERTETPWCALCAI